MNQDELFKRVRRIEIKTRALTQNVFAGEYHSAFKGRGMSPAEVREYHLGDDVRDIEWNVTARMNRPHIKVYEEERELTVILLIDVSNSLNFGTRGSSSRDRITEIAATLAFSASVNNDKIGVIFFSDKIEKFIPPQKSRKHILYIIRELLNFSPSSTQTDIGKGLEYLLKIISRRAIVFVLSDFIDVKDYSINLRIAAHRHDMVALRVYDYFQCHLPNVGLMLVKDLENATEREIDTSNVRVREAYAVEWQKKSEELDQLFKKCGVDAIDIVNDQDYSKALLQLFHSR